MSNSFTKHIKARLDLVLRALRDDRLCHNDQIVLAHVVDDFVAPYPPTMAVDLGMAIEDCLAAIQRLEALGYLNQHMGAPK